MKKLHLLCKRRRGVSNGPAHALHISQVIREHDVRIAFLQPRPFAVVEEIRTGIVDECPAAF